VVVILLLVEEEEEDFIVLDVDDEDDDSVMFKFYETVDLVVWMMRPPSKPGLECGTRAETDGYYTMGDDGREGT